MNGKSEITERYSGRYTEKIDKISGISYTYINSFREAGFEKIREIGITTKKNEAYKYTNLNIFFDHDYKSYFMPVTSDFVKAEEFRCDVADLDTHGIVLLNGFYPTLNDKLR